MYFIISKGMPINSYVSVIAETRVAAINVFIENYYDDIMMIAMSERPSSYDISGKNLMEKFSKTLKAGDLHHRMPHEFSTRRSEILKRLL